MKQYRIENATVEEFAALFSPKSEYLAAAKQMSAKEVVLDWKPSNRVEELIKFSVIENALVKVGAGSLRVTSYLLAADASSAEVYISYGGKQLKLTREGRDNDSGGFFRASQDGPHLVLEVQTRFERYKTRYVLFSLGGCLFFFVPGLLIGTLLLAVNSKTADRLGRTIVPAVEAALREANPVP